MSVPSHVPYTHTEHLLSLGWTLESQGLLRPGSCLRAAPQSRRETCYHPAGRMPLFKHGRKVLRRRKSGNASQGICSVTGLPRSPETYTVEKSGKERCSGGNSRCKDKKAQKGREGQNVAVFLLCSQTKWPWAGGCLAPSQE